MYVLASQNNDFRVAETDGSVFKRWEIKFYVFGHLLKILKLHLANCLNNFWFFLTETHKMKMDYCKKIESAKIIQMVIFYGKAITQTS